VATDFQPDRLVCALKRRKGKDKWREQTTP
jgi:hypothetical protein